MAYRNQPAPLSRKSKSVPNGFECEFVAEPPKEVQSKCPICLQILKEPFQVSCCGYNFCQLCISSVLSKSRSCPLCKNNDFTTFFNKGLQRTLNEFKVHCSHSMKGCQWIGELGEFLKHLNHEPGFDQQLKGCMYEDIKCIYCQKILERRHIQLHQADECNKRSYICVYCGDYSSHYKDVVSNHWPVCPEIAVPCMFNCGVDVPRKYSDEHVTLCGQTQVDCDFKSFGCEEKILRKLSKNHTQYFMAHHLALVANSYSKMKVEVQTQKTVIENLSNKLTAQQHCLQNLEKAQTCITQSHNTLCDLVATPPIRLSINNFTRIKEEGRTWMSAPFYTHQKGYKMCLQVHPRSLPTGSTSFSISVYLFLMKGEYDAILNFPLDLSVVVHLLSIERRFNSLQRTIVFHEHTLGCPTGRITSGVSAEEGWGFVLSFKDVRDLKNYLLDDCLSFEIASVKLHLV